VVAEEWEERIDAVSRTFLGLTVACARCHDHKFDPISQRDYYSLFAFFNTQDEPALELTTPGDKQARADHEARRQEFDRIVARLDPVTPERVASWENGLSAADKAKLPADIRKILALAPARRSLSQKSALAAACRPAEPLLPDPGRARVYDAAYRRYRAVIASDLARAGPVCQHAASGDEEGLP